jgi:MFS family permease
VVSISCFLIYRRYGNIGTSVSFLWANSSALSVASLLMLLCRCTKPAGFASIVEGFRYAASRPELIGTYVVDIVALTFAMPMAAFPALAVQWGGAQAIGPLYSAMSAGSLIITIFSGWTRNVRRHGAAVVLGALSWGLAITGLGFSRSLPIAVGCLMLAGAADMVSGLFRMTIWNETIPSHLRGRMAGIEQISYMIGPNLGNTRAGFMAERFGPARSIVLGGLVCGRRPRVRAVVAGILALSEAGSERGLNRLFWEGAMRPMCADG